MTKNSTRFTLKRIRAEYLHVVKIIFTENYALVIISGHWSQIISKFMYAFYTIWSHIHTCSVFGVDFKSQSGQTCCCIYAFLCIFNHQNCPDSRKIHQKSAQRKIFLFPCHLFANQLKPINLRRSTWKLNAERFIGSKIEFVVKYFYTYTCTRYDNHRQTRKRLK